MWVDGFYDILLIAVDGEYGAVGICYGVFLGGGRVFNVISVNGFMYVLEQFFV